MADDEKDAAGDPKAIPPPPYYRRFYPAAAPAGRRVFFCLLFLLLILLGATALVLYLIYRPSKPSFAVTAAAVYQLSANASLPFASNAIFTNMQFTLLARNPNHRAAVHFDHLAAYAVYRGQPVTPLQLLPPLVLEKGASVVMSPVLGGGSVVPAAPEFAEGLATDLAYGVVGLKVVVMGRVKYKTGPFRSGWARLCARCDVMLGLRGQAPLLGEPRCFVDT